MGVRCFKTIRGIVDIFVRLCFLHEMLNGSKPQCPGEQRLSPTQDLLQTDLFSTLGHRFGRKVVLQKDEN